MKRAFITSVLMIITATSFVIGAAAKDDDPQSVITRYVSAHKKWKPSEYRIERRDTESGRDVYWVIWRAEEHRATAGGGGKSFAVLYDAKTHRVVEELAFQ